MVDVGLVMNALEVLDTLRVLGREFHRYVPWHYVDTDDDDWDWRCKLCGLPLLHDSHGRPHWYLSFGRAAQSEVDDRLLEYKNNRTERAIIEASIEGEGRL